MIDVTQVVNAMLSASYKDRHWRELKETLEKMTFSSKEVQVLNLIQQCKKTKQRIQWANLDIRFKENKVYVVVYKRLRPYQVFREFVE